MKTLPAQLSAFLPALLDARNPKVENAAWKNRYELLITASGQLLHEYDVITGDMIWRNPNAERHAAGGSDSTKP